MKLRSLLSFAGLASVIDPCVGQGTALELVTSDAPVRRYGVELNAERAHIAGSKGIETIQGNTFDTIARPESFSLLYLNPPYDSSGGLPGPAGPVLNDEYPCSSSSANTVYLPNGRCSNRNAPVSFVFCPGERHGKRDPKRRGI